MRGRARPTSFLAQHGRRAQAAKLTKSCADARVCAGRKRITIVRKDPTPKNGERRGDIPMNPQQRETWPVRSPGLPQFRTQSCIVAKCDAWLRGERGAVTLRNESVELLASPERSPKDACVAYDPSPTGLGVPDAKGRRPAIHTASASNLVECRLSLLQRDGVIPSRTLEHREAGRQVFELKHESPRIGRGTGSTGARDHHKRGDNDHHPTFFAPIDRSSHG